MKIKFSEIYEQSYKGNIGIAEVMKFYTIASSEQKNKLKKLIDAGKQKEAWRLVQDVTGVELVDK